MTLLKNKKVAVHRLAARLEEDISRRGLVEGDTYLTADEAGEMLGVSRSTAQRALRFLANSEKLIRHRNLGTFIGPAGVSAPETKVRTLLVLATEDKRIGFEFDRLSSILGALRSQISASSVNLTFLPTTDAVGFVERLLRSITIGSELVGILAVSCPREIYQFLAESKLPALACGSLYDDVIGLPSVDRDNFEAGRLLASYLISRGHRRMGLIASTHGRPGDHDFIDGVSAALSAAGLPPDAMVLRIVPTESHTWSSAVRNLLQSDRPITGLIARGGFLGNAIHSVVSDLQIKVPEQLEIVFETGLNGKVEYPGDECPHSVAKIGPEEMATLWASILNNPKPAGLAGRNRVVVPVELRSVRSIAEK